MAPSLVPIQGVARFGIAEDSIYANGNGYLTSAVNLELHGAGHMGVGPLDRIIMSLNSGIESEIEYALSTLSYYSCNEPKLLNFSVYPLMGNELIKYFVKPYHLIAEGKSQDVTLSMMLLSVESLLSLRNAVQDLPNQQWLCQIKSFRKYAVEALKFLTGWFYSTLSPKLFNFAQFNELFRESLNHLLDILDPLTCFYIDNAKNDPLFHQLLILLSNTSDKYVLIVTLKCLYHLMFLGGANALSPKQIEDVTPEANNCIDAVQPEHLLIILRNLFINDDEITFHVLLFVKQYLFSEALHPQYGSSVASSQLHRMRKLINASSSKGNLHILMKQLPELIVARLPLVDPSKVQQTIPVRLARRSAYSGVPSTTAKLPEKLYKIIIAFPEPLRATTWLRCCYEPYTAVGKSGEDAKDLTAGEVTQISLWKAYENQFEAIWKDRLNPAWPNLLPAVDFIKNVSSAFPNSEAMVVNMPSSDPLQPARKKFIIKGIQPRQFPVSIELGNFEALRRIPASLEELATSQSVGEVDEVAFDNALTTYNSSILIASEGLTGPDDVNAPWYSPINLLARDILGKIVDDLLEPDMDGAFKNIFRQYNKDWLPDLVYANPGLVEQSYIEGQWLLYLL